MDNQDENDDANFMELDGKMTYLELWCAGMSGAIELFNSQAVGGLPEAWSSKLHRFMTAIYRKVNEVKPYYHLFIDSTGDLRKLPRNFDERLRDLQEMWEHVINEADERKTQLENKLNESIVFQEKLQSFDDWLSNTENTVANFRPFSRRTSNLDSQIHENTRLQQDVQTYRDKLAKLKQLSAQFDVGQKQDITLINNLLISVEHRLTGVSHKINERGRLLHALKTNFPHLLSVK